MDNDYTNQNTQQRPMLRKVKRPINRAPQMPVNSSVLAQQPSYSPVVEENDTEAQVQLTNNPFVTQKNNDAFSLDTYLDDSVPATRHFLGEEEIQAEQKALLADYEEQLAQEEAAEVSDLPPYLTKKILILIGVLIFFIGIVTTKIFFSEEKVVRNGLQGVVVNPEVPKGRARCGVAERTQGCILYLMNPQRRDVPARDFYDLAAQLTGRQRFVIETGNMRYSNVKIRPGDIAQFNIPPM